MRNRIGTLIFVLKTAEKGGGEAGEKEQFKKFDFSGTVFPSIGTTIRINPGDAFFWFNTQADESQVLQYSSLSTVTCHLSGNESESWWLSYL